METAGNILKKKRESLGFSLEQIAEDTKIRKKYLEAIESGTYNQIPDIVYTKSFLRIYSDYLELDQVFVLKRFFDEIPPQESPNLSLKKTPKIPFTFTSWHWIGLMVLVSVVVGLVVWQFTMNRNAVRTPIAENTISTPSEISESDPPLHTPEPQPEEIIPNVAPIKELEESSTTAPFFDRLLISLKADTKNGNSCWVLPVVDGVNRSSYTLKDSVDSASYECKKTFRVNLGNAGIVTFTVNGFILTDLGKTGEVISVDITLFPEQQIVVDTIINGIVTNTKRFENKSKTP